MASPSPRRTGRGLGRGEFNGVWTALLSPALSSLRGRRGGGCRVGRGNVLNSTAVAPGTLPHGFTARMLKELQFGRGLPMKLDGD